MLTKVQVDAEIRELEKRLVAIKATGGYKYRALFRATDAEIDAYCAKAVNTVRGLLLRAMAGEQLAWRWGKEAELELILKELVATANARTPNPAVVAAAEAVVRAAG